jgi:hypothetical protein
MWIRGALFARGLPPFPHLFFPSALPMRDTCMGRLCLLALCSCWATPSRFSKRANRKKERSRNFRVRGLFQNALLGAPSLSPTVVLLLSPPLLLPSLRLPLRCPILISQSSALLSLCTCLPIFVTPSSSSSPHLTPLLPHHRRSSPTGRTRRSPSATRVLA